MRKMSDRLPNDDFHKQDTVPDVVAGAPDRKATSAPEKIGPYKIEAVLEKGGMSLVYLATHPDSGDPITIKVLLPQYLSHPEMVQRFVNEAEIIALADHPNIVKLYGHGEWAGGLYIAMEYIQGVSLREYLAKKPLSLKRALEVVLEIAYAICHLHTHGVIHRDLKPENILITEGEKVKVIDFGIAQLLDEDQSKSSGKHRFIGTPVYMSPEQRHHPELVSYPADIYALGIITYELVLGRLSLGQIHLSLMPKGLQKILAKALQPKIEDRYQDIVDFIADISGYLNSALPQKERKENDHLSDLSHNLQRAQQSLLPKHTPTWPRVEIGLVTHKGVSVSGVYYDFYDLPEGSYGVLLAEPSVKGAEGMIYTSVLRGMVRTLARFTSKPSELVTLLNEILTHDPMDQIFTLSYLILVPKNNLFHYISCGYGHLWHVESGAKKPKKITADNMALGIDAEAVFSEVAHPWNVGDTLVLNTFATIAGIPQKNSSTFSETDFERTLSENLYKPPQKQVEIIFHKALAAITKSVEDRSISIISLLRKD